MAADGVHRGYVDNAPGTLPQHWPRAGLRQYQSCGEVNFDSLNNIARAHCWQNSFRCHAGIVDEHVNSAQPLAHFFDKGAQRLVIASIHRPPMKIPRLAGTQQVGNEGCLRPTQRRHPVPPVEKPGDEFSSQAATTPANQRDLSGLWHRRRILTLTNLRSGICADATRTNVGLRDFLKRVPVYQASSSASFARDPCPFIIASTTCIAWTA